MLLHAVQFFEHCDVSF